MVGPGDRLFSFGNNEPQKKQVLVLSKFTLRHSGHFIYVAPPLVLIALLMPIRRLLTRFGMLDVPIRYVFIQTSPAKLY